MIKKYPAFPFTQWFMSVSVGSLPEQMTFDFRDDFLKESSLL